MALVALEGARLTQSTASSHINIQRYQYTGDSGYPDYSPYYGWVGGYTISATINGTCKSSATNVFIQGKKPVLKDDGTTESDTYSLGSNERYSSGQHTNSTSGKVSGGNSRNVYVNGKLVAISGSSVTTHANTSTTIANSGLSSTVNIG